MASTSVPPLPPRLPKGVSAKDLESFRAHLSKSTRILALLGAGLSASSGLPTFRGAGGLWRTHEATQLATPEAFAKDPGLVWQFYSYRRHMALNAQPNPAHYALAEFAKKRGNGFITLSQNVDGLSPRAGHPPETLKLLHGSLFDVKCTSFYCTYKTVDYTDPIVPSLTIPTTTSNTPIDPTTTAAQQSQSQSQATTQQELDISDISVPLRSPPPEELPRCPHCRDGLLRPGVVWFGEMLPQKTLDEIDEWIDAEDNIDLMIVVGTSAAVWPAAGYIHTAKSAGARVAVVNPDEPDNLDEDDWHFGGDAAEILPLILGEEITE